MEKDIVYMYYTVNSKVPLVCLKTWQLQFISNIWLDFQLWLFITFKWVYSKVPGVCIETWWLQFISNVWFDSQLWLFFIIRSCGPCDTHLSHMMGIHRCCCWDSHGTQWVYSPPPLSPPLQDLHSTICSVAKFT